MISKGEIDKESARTHSRKNVITRAIGAEAKIIADFFEVDIKTDTKILLCSDGLSNMVEDSQINKIIEECSGKTLEETVHKLIDAANENGGCDNIAVVLAQV